MSDVGYVEPSIRYKYTEYYNRVFYDLNKKKEVTKNIYARCWVCVRK